MTPVIEVENLEVRYDGHVALSNVTASIPQGTIGLLGQNGAGKSTFLKTILGFLRPHQGKVRVLGYDLPEEVLEVRQRIGYMPEREAVSPKISAVNFLTYCGRLLGMSRTDAIERTHEVLSYVGLGESRYRKMQTYSTGMLQRVKLAQAIMHDPKLVLLDEPTNGLDPIGRNEMLRLIQDIAQKRNVTVILSSHLLPDIQQVCEHVVMIAKGKLVRQGTIKDLISLTENSFEIALRDHHEEFMRRLKDHGFLYTEQEDGSLLVTSLNGTHPSTLFRIALECQTQIRNFRCAQQKLEEIFLKAVREN